MVKEQLMNQATLRRGIERAKTWSGSGTGTNSWAGSYSWAGSCSWTGFRSGSWSGSWSGATSRTKPW